MINIHVKVDLDENDLGTCCNTRLTISNPKTLMGTTTHQEVWDMVVPTWHDVNYEYIYLKTLPIFMHCSKS
jgi:hypothetical protein